MVNAMHHNSATLSTGLKCFRMWIQPLRVFTRFSQTFDEVEMPTRSYMTSHAPSFGNYQYSITYSSMWIQPVRVFTRFSQTFDEVKMPTRSSVQEQHLREVVFRVEFVLLHNRLFQRQFIFVDAICLLQAALS